jgi:hypothetical protein
MASLQELNSYQGNAALAGGTAGVPSQLGVYDFKQTSDAVDRFSQMHVQMNRDMWHQRNLEIQRTAEKAAQDLSFKYGDLIPEDQNEIDGAVKDLYDFYYQKPNAVRYQIDPKTGDSNAEDYKQFLALKQKVDHYIVRGNARAAQLKAVQADMSQTTDPATLQRYQQFITGERQKPITENILTMPPLTQFSGSKFIEALSTEATNQFGFVQYLGNDNQQVEMKIFNPEAAASKAMSVFMNPTGENAEAAAFIRSQTGVFNQLVNTLKEAAPRNEDGSIKQDAFNQYVGSVPEGRVLMDLQNRYNQYIGQLNSQYVVENGQKTDRKLRERMGITQDLRPINIADGITEDEFVKLSLVGKAKLDVKATNQHTGQASEDARWRADDRYRWTVYGDEKDKEIMMGAEKNTIYTALTNAHLNGLGQKAVINRTEKLPDGSTRQTTTDLGYEVGLDQALINAFSKPGDKNQVTQRTPNATEQAANNLLGGGSGSTNNYTQVQSTRSYVRPQRLFVIPDKGGDPNKSQIHVRYEDGSTADLNTTQLYSSLNYIYGDDDKTVQETSKQSYMHLTKRLGLSVPDAGRMVRKQGSYNQGRTDQAAPGSATTTVKDAQGNLKSTKKNTGKLAGINWNDL